MTARTFSLQPAAKNIANAFDYFGMLMGLLRIPGEKNVAYRKRLWDVYVHRAGPTEQGLINGITRELGLKQFDALTISYIGSTSNSPRVIVRDVQIELYSNWNLVDEAISPNVLDGTAIDTFTRSSDAYYVGGLIEEINNSTNFRASIINGVSDKALSACLIDQDSRKWVEAELLKPFYRNTLDHRNIIPGTLTFSSEGMNVFMSQKSTEDLVVAPGDYYIDYDNSILISYTPPSEEIICRYMCDELPLTLTASPVILHEFGSSYFRSKVFEQILQPDGTYVDGLPLDAAIKYINELMAAKGMLWGT
jgi:hypothetical protein